MDNNRPHNDRNTLSVIAGGFKVPSGRQPNVVKRGKKIDMVRDQVGSSRSCLPLCYGDNLDGWISQIDRYFTFYSMKEEERGMQRWLGRMVLLSFVRSGRRADLKKMMLRCFVHRREDFYVNNESRRKLQKICTI